MPEEANERPKPNCPPTRRQKAVINAVKKQEPVPEQKPVPKNTFMGIPSDIPSTSRIAPPVAEGKDPKHIECLHKKTAENVVVLGFTESRMQCPYFADKEWELWGCNELYKFVPRLDVLFEIHSRKEWGPDCGSGHGPVHTKWLQENKKLPVYMAEKYEDVPMCIEYPWYAVTHMTPHSDYINNQISVMVALAIFMSYKKIALYGCEMAHHTELGTQRPSVEYFIGLAEGLGIEVTMNENCSLLNAPFIYGLESGSKWVKVMQDYVGLYGKRVQDLSNQQTMVLGQLNQYIGAKNAVDEIVRHKLGQ